MPTPKRQSLLAPPMWPFKDLETRQEADESLTFNRQGIEHICQLVTFSGWGLRFYSRQNKTNTVSAEVHLTAETGNGALKGLQPTIRIDAGSGD